jgi:hypothetical protein
MGFGRAGAVATDSVANNQQILRCAQDDNEAALRMTTKLRSGMTKATRPRPQWPRACALPLNSYFENSDYGAVFVYVIRVSCPAVI